jgi:hypothetical protein
MVQIKFIKYGANSAFGGFAPGDRMRCDEAMAKHLVEEVGVAEYAAAPAPAEPVQAPAPSPAPAAPATAKRVKKA